MTILVPKNSVFHSIRPDDVTMTSNLLELTNFPGCGTTENEIYVKFCLRKSLLEKDSIVHKFLPKPGRICRDFCCRGHRRLKKTTGVFFPLFVLFYLVRFNLGLLLSLKVCEQEKRLGYKINWSVVS